MGGPKLLALVLAVSAAALAGGSSLSAQCRLCDTPTTSRPGLGGGDELNLEIETSLNFDSLIMTNAGQGAAVVRPDGSNSAEGGVAQVSPRAVVGTAIVRGAPGRALRVELPTRIDLYSTGGGRISVDEIATDLPRMPRLDAAGNLTFRFGGRVSISGESEGNYRGEMPITVEYQ